MHFFLVDFLCSATGTGALAWVEFAETSLYFEVILSVRRSAMETLRGSLRRMTDCRIAMVTSVSARQVGSPHLALQIGGGDEAR